MSTPVGKRARTPHELRQQAEREQRLKDIREQVAQGKLVIRQMSPEERRRYPPRESLEPRVAPKRR
jgi:hypothetical protein